MTIAIPPALVATLIADGQREAARNVVTDTWRTGGVVSISGGVAQVLVDGDVDPIPAIMVGTLDVGERCLVVFTAAGAIWAFAGPGGGTRGLVAPAVAVTTDQGGITTALTPLNLMTVTWVARPSVVYRTWGKVDVFSSAAGDLPLLQVVDTVPNQKGATQGPQMTLINTVYTVEVTAIESGLTGSQTRNLLLRRFAGSGTFTARGTGGAPKLLTVEAIGSI